MQTKKYYEREHERKKIMLSYIIRKTKLNGSVGLRDILEEFRYAKEYDIKKTLNDLIRKGFVVQSVSGGFAATNK